MKKLVVVESYNEIVFPEPSEYQAMLWMIRRGDTKDHPLTQWFLNFSKADELLKLAAARQQLWGLPSETKPTLDWPTRKKIALGAGRGLLYLHEQCDPKIIHRDVKAKNILLDDYCEAVVGDFGLAKLLDHMDSYVTTTIKQLSFETETARREEKEMRSKTQELKQEAEKSKAVAKELEKKLELYLQQAEGAKASE
ncbi:hypothetical protein JHK85_007235 [Glycine max]|nr:hypothetical protein JHK85_007235 [Glycine max]